MVSQFFRTSSHHSTLEDRARHRVQVPYLHEVIEELMPLPPYSMVLGVCEDGLPLLLDLTNPGPGQILLLGDNEFGNRELLRSVIQSVSLLNDRKQASTHLITPRPEYYPELSANNNHVKTYDPFHPESQILIEEVSNLVDARKAGMARRPVQVLAIDGLELLLNELDESQNEQLEWILKAGHHAQVWVVASTVSGTAGQSSSDAFDLFGTRVFGRVQRPQTLRGMQARNPAVLADAIPGVEAYVESGDEEIKILIPQVDVLQT
jgi:hypothetical protein